MKFQKLSLPQFNLAATLESGQTFCWQKKSQTMWEGWVKGYPCRAWQEETEVTIEVCGDQEEVGKAVDNYFQVQENIDQIIATFPDDPWMQQAMAYAPGLRVLRQEPWETTVNFICSALKQIPHIQQINATLRREFGTEVYPGFWKFPTMKQLVLVSEMELRRCKLGFRAKNLRQALDRLAAGEVDLDELANLSTQQARQKLMSLGGVGEKVANCILLFAYGRYEVFPIDVWMERLLRQLYFVKKRSVTRQRLREFSEKYFGSCRGYAQQYLFHWARHHRNFLEDRVKE